MKKAMVRILFVLLGLSILISAFLIFHSSRPGEKTDATLDLGNAWTDVFPVSRRTDTDIIVRNLTAQAEVMVRIVDAERVTLVGAEKRVAPGGIVIFSDFPAGSYIIQGKSADDLPREYSLHLGN